MNVVIFHIFPSYTQGRCMCALKICIYHRFGMTTLPPTPQISFDIYLLIQYQAWCCVLEHTVVNSTSILQLSRSYRKLSDFITSSFPSLSPSLFT